MESSHTGANSDRSASRRIILTTFGSLGDLHPSIAIGRVLLRRNHRPLIATSEHWRSKVEAEGLEFAPIRPDAPPPEEIPDFMKQVFHPTKGPALVINQMMDALAESFEDTDRAAEGADLIVSHPLTFAAGLVAEYRGIPRASTALAPLSLFSKLDPPSLPPAWWVTLLQQLGPFFTVPLSLLVNRLTSAWGRPWHRFRASLGLPDAPGVNPILGGQHSDQLILGLFSESLARRQPDWPTQTVITGFPFYDQDDADDSESAQLQAFLDDGPPPLTFTLGSSAVFASGSFYQESLEAVRRLGTRAVFLVGPEGANALPAGLPKEVIALRYAPYSEIFPRSSAIIHQGGVGTTAQAMRAGKPMLIVPFGFDQFDHADRMSRLKLGRSLKLSSYRASRVSIELARLLESADYKAQAAEVAQKISVENGAEAAVDALEVLLNQTPRAGSRPS